MKRIINYVFIYTLILPMSVRSQHTASMNTGLRRALSQPVNSGRMVSLIVKSNNPALEEITKESGGIYKFTIGNLSSISLPLNKINSFVKQRDIISIEGLYGSGKLFDEMTLVNANVNPVHQGLFPLAQPYDGKGVVIAVLDDGIDIHHPDFQNADGTTRIKFLWDQTSITGGNIPQPYNYGQEWDSDAINSGSCTHVEPYYEYGHGSNVSGIAASNGLAVNNFYGVAPASDLLVVAVDMGENFLNNVVDATKYAFDKAAELHEPCVINASIGTYFGSHDGLDLAALLIDSLIASQSGRTFVCAAGNAGNIPFHLGYQIQTDSAFTWFKYAPNIPGVFFEWWINKSEADSFNFAIGADNTNPFFFEGRTKYYNLKNDFDLPSGAPSLMDTLWNAGLETGIISINVQAFDSTYSCDVFITSANTSDLWRFITNGSGKFDLWSGLTTTGTSDIIYSDLPDSVSFPDISRYKVPDTQETIVSSFSCSDKVITVGNFTNRNQYIDVNGNLQIFTSDTTGQLAISSSFGPSRDGRIKPDITAPGNRTLTSGNLLTLQNLLLYQPFKVALGGLHNSNGGTSMASPVVAGIAVLYLEKKPAANWKEVKDAILFSATKDQYTGPDLPDNHWGYGKADAFAAMTNIISYGCTDPASTNYNSDATVDNGSCIYLSEILTQHKNFSFSCFPNPFHSFTNFSYDLDQNSNCKILITDISGYIYNVIKLHERKGTVSFENPLQPGIYLYLLQTGVRILSTGKMVVF
ncbi:MAG: S8 family serine peptidase [Chitinophagales bacterium]|nr:S8 family serine peptidase [Chitinophagales bacterium]